MNSKNVVSALRRDVTFVGNALIVLMFVGFVGLALAATLLDVVSLHR